MKTMLVFFAVFCSLATFGLSCPSCGQSMLVTDKYCPNCGKERNVESPKTIPHPSYDLSTYYHNTTDRGHGSGNGSSSTVGDRFTGTGRGMATVALSPLNIVRGVTTGFNWTKTLGASDGYVFIGIVGFTAVLGSFATCADAINGTFDMVSVGYYGDWLYDSRASGKPTPWIWERKWLSNQIPWIDRE